MENYNDGWGNFPGREEDIDTSNTEFTTSLKQVYDDFEITDKFREDHKELFEETRPLYDDKVIDEARKRVADRIGKTLPDLVEYKNKQDEEISKLR